MPGGQGQAGAPNVSLVCAGDSQGICHAQEAYGAMIARAGLSSGKVVGSTASSQSSSCCDSSRPASHHRITAEPQASTRADAHRLECTTSLRARLCGNKPFRKHGGGSVQACAQCMYVHVLVRTCSRVLPPGVAGAARRQWPKVPTPPPVPDRPHSQCRRLTSSWRSMTRTSRP
jgi:hypothetical protein